MFFVFCFLFFVFCFLFFVFCFLFFVFCFLFCVLYFEKKEEEKKGKTKGKNLAFSSSLDKSFLQKSTSQLVIRSKKSANLFFLRKKIKNIKN